MKRLAFAVMIAILLGLAAVPLAVSAEGSPPVGGCPAVFMLHEIGEHMDHHDHHIGLKVDLNGDGQICVRHLDNGLHVHMDNVLK